MNSLGILPIYLAPLIKTTYLMKRPWLLIENRRHYTKIVFQLHKFSVALSALLIQRFLKASHIKTIIGSNQWISEYFSLNRLVISGNSYKKRHVEPRATSHLIAIDIWHEASSEGYAERFHYLRVVYLSGGVSIARAPPPPRTPPATSPHNWLNMKIIGSRVPNMIMTQSEAELECFAVVE